MKQVTFNYLLHLRKHSKHLICIYLPLKQFLYGGVGYKVDTREPKLAWNLKSSCLSLPRSELQASTTISAFFETVLKVLIVHKRYVLLLTTSYRTERWCQVAWGEGTCSSHNWHHSTELKHEIYTGTSHREQELLVSWERFRSDASQRPRWHRSRWSDNPAASTCNVHVKLAQPLVPSFHSEIPPGRENPFLSLYPHPFFPSPLSPSPSVSPSLTPYLSLSLSLNLDTLSDVFLSPVLTCLPASN